MGLILWPAALLLFLFWSLAAWLIFGLSEWAAGHVATAVGGVLTAELGTWATTLINSLGALIKFGVVAVWAIVSIGLLGAPMWLRRQRRAGHIPDYYTQGYPPRSRPHNTPSADFRKADDEFEEQRHRRGDHDKPWRDRQVWQERAQQSYGEASYLRDAVGEMMGKYRRKKKKKRDDDDD